MEIPISTLDSSLSVAHPSGTLISEQPNPSLGTLDRLVVDDEDSSTVIEEPYIGQEFESLDDVYDFYNFYAFQCGFGIRKSSSTKSKVSHMLNWKKYECDKSGLKRLSSTDVKAHRDTRVGCFAKIEVRKNNDQKWFISQFVKEHNHPLDTPRRTRKHRSHNKAHKNPIVKGLMDQLHQSGFGPSKIAKALNTSIASSSINTQTVIEHLRVGRKNNIGREGVLVASYLHSQTVQDKEFYYALELSSEGILRSIFWVDSRARKDFEIFGDVIVFDVTYRTNSFSMPFAPFTGVNHHRQSTLFGCALLADETEETFIWLFEHWLECMSGKAPNAIITDMDLAMYNAIKKVFPNTRHRFCSWHIGKHLLEHIHGLRNADSEFSKDYKKWFNSKYISTSENRWKELVEKYQIDNNSWLASMWDRKTHWVPAYLKDVFVAGMSSSSRSESINAFFDGFVTSKTALIDFVKQYEHALASRRRAELSEDFKTMNTIACLQSQSPLEASVAKYYTRSMFKLFQTEFKPCLDCWKDKISSIDKVKTYRVGLPHEKKKNWCTVIYNENDGLEASCDCALFETAGYLCKHILHIMVKKRVMEVPSKYVLKRWTIEARNVSQKKPSTYWPDASSAITPLMKWNLIAQATKVAELSSNSMDAYIDFKKSLEIRQNELEKQREHIAMMDQISQNPECSSLPQITIRDPLIMRTKGRPKIASRVPSGLEASQAITKKRMCGNCGDKGHYTTTCPNKSKGKQHE